MKILLYPFIICGTIVGAKFSWIIACILTVIVKQKKDKMTDELWTEYFDTLNPSKFLLQVSTMYMLCLGFCSFLTKSILLKLSFQHATSLSISSFLLGMCIHLVKALKNKDILLEKLKNIKNNITISNS